MSSQFYKIKKNPEYPNLSRELDDRIVNPLSVILFLAEEVRNADVRERIEEAAKRILGVVREMEERSLIY